MNISFTSTEAFFRNDAGEVSHDPCVLMGGRHSLNPAGVFSVLQLGAIVPPLSPWQGIERVVPRGLLSTTAGLEEQDLSTLDAGVDLLIQRIDAALAQIKKPILLFSGGVDSGLLAARLAAIGRTDAVLFHFSLGESDVETIVAKEMAGHLGLKLEICMAEGLDQLACLQEPGRIYTSPFADESTSLMFGLAKTIALRFAGDGATVIDGTGADGAFGMDAKVRRWLDILKIPKGLRKIFGLPYAAGAWLQCGMVEYLSRLMERSCSMSPLSACIAQNPLAGVIYTAEHSEEVYRALDKWVYDEVKNNVKLGMVVADLGLTCANIFAQKGAPIFKSAGLNVSYPFLSDAIVALGMSVLGKDFSRRPKEILRVALKRHVRREWVDRPKSGFVDPAQSVFLSAGFIEILEATMETSSPIGDFLVKKNIAKSCGELSSGRLLPQQTMNCLWAVAFTDRWYRTACPE